MCGKRVKIELEGRIMKLVMEFTRLVNMISKYNWDIETKMHKYNKLNRMIKRHLGKQMLTETKLQIHNTISKATIRSRSQLWIINRKKQEQLGQTTPRP
jgi:hypothetical protein